MFTIGDFKDARLFFGLIEQESFNAHLGYEFKLKIDNRDLMDKYDAEPCTTKFTRVGLKGIYRVKSQVLYSGKVIQNLKKAGSKVSIEGSNERTVSYSHYQRTGES